MNNSIEFIVRMRDLMSGGLGRLSSTAQSSFSQISRSTNQASGLTKVLGMSYEELQRKIQGVEQTIRTSTIPAQIAEARRELSSLQSMAARHQGNLNRSGTSGGGSAPVGIGGIALGNMLGNMATRAGGMIVNTVTSSIGSAMANSMAKESAITGLSTFLGRDGAQQAYAQIRKDADATPFDTQSLLMVNRSLISAGLNAKDAREDTLNLANAVSAVGGGNAELSRMAANMQQIKTVGVATAMDIKQFGMAGINIYEMLARATGKNIDQVKEMDVSYELLSKAMKMAKAEGGMYAGALEAQGATRAGKWGAIVDKFSNAGVDLIDKFSPFIDTVLTGVGQVADNLGVWIERADPFITLLNDGLTSAYKWTSDIVSMIWNISAPVIQWVKQSMLVRDIFRGIGWIFNVWSEKVKEALTLVKHAWVTFIKPALDVMERVYRMVRGGSDSPQKSPKPKGVPNSNPQGLPVGPVNPSLLGSNLSEGAKTADTITGGPKTINISVAKFFDTIQFTTMDSNESAQKLEEVVMEVLSRVLLNGSKLA